MPLYEFRNGRTIQEFRVSSGTTEIEFGGRKWERLPVHRFAMSGIHKESTMAQEVKKAAYNIEQRCGSRFPSMFSKNTIRKVWGI